MFNWINISYFYILVHEQTIIYQVLTLFLIIVSLLLSYLGIVKWVAKFVLSIANLFISIVFLNFCGTDIVFKNDFNEAYKLGKKMVSDWILLIYKRFLFNWNFEF